MKLKNKVVLALVVLLGLLGTSAFAADITIDSVGDTGTLTSGDGNGYVFGLSPVLQGVGNSKVFLTINQSTAEAPEQGYNTEGTVEFETIASGTTALLISDLAVAYYGGTSYYQFVFALNSTGGDPNMSINEIRIFQANAGNLTGYPGFGGNATEVWDWQSSAGNTLTVIDYIPGLDNTEMLLLVPTAAFDQVGKDYVMFYMAAGSPELANDGPDKWIARDQCNTFGLTGVTCEPPQVPEPSSLLLLLTGFGLVGAAGGRKMISRLSRN